MNMERNDSLPDYTDVSKKKRIYFCVGLLIINMIYDFYEMTKTKLLYVDRV